MKNEIQRKLQTEYEGLTLEERKALMDRRIRSNPVLAPRYRRSMEKMGTSKRGGRRMRQNTGQTIREPIDF